MTMFPTAAACRLIWLISAPVWRWSWKVSESRWTWREEVAAQVEDHVLLGLRPEVVVEHGEARCRPRRSGTGPATIETRTTQTSGSAAEDRTRRTRSGCLSCRTSLRITASGHGSARPDHGGEDGQADRPRSGSGDRAQVGLARGRAFQSSQALALGFAKASCRPLAPHPHGPMLGLIAVPASAPARRAPRSGRLPFGIGRSRQARRAQRAARGGGREPRSSRGGIGLGPPLPPAAAAAAARRAPASSPSPCPRPRGRGGRRSPGPRSPPTAC